mgnify:CR=1 FL=1
MPELIAKSALDGKSRSIGGMTLAEAAPGPIHSLALFPAGSKAAAKGLKTLGLSFPAPNSFAEKKGARIVWSGRDQAFLIGVAPPELEGVAITDQTDGWTTLALSGPGVTEVLARLVPVDLRLAACPVGCALRTQVNHMNAVVLRLAEDRFEIMVFRSMARSAWHEIDAAMHMVAARQGMKI